ncbi:hypothetical protein B9Z34_03220 [Limnohabitans sp. Hippo3]|nr:hypothetical protein B9Z34_03220 [Limnohabitans sp. Hippo3]
MATLTALTTSTTIAANTLREDACAGHAQGTIDIGDSHCTANTSSTTDAADVAVAANAAT